MIIAGLTRSISISFPVLGGVACCLEVGAMIDEDAQAARRYRQRAREVRTVAKTVEEMTTRSALLEIARDYDSLALTRLRIGKAARSIQRTRRKLP